ncbi:hypothetical protein [Acidimangrovimonas pyrenivorans]|uniref:General stress protein 17M-like domain-containing protein n=1 Tax=Acidimangrovimonas pyrenivorans TaxID=2030798 RepID=A0ABV7AC99_9RHOB
MSDTAATTNKMREVVAVFHDAGKLEAAAEELLKAGFSESRLSVMGDRKAVAKKLGHHFEPIEVMEDDPRVPQRAFIQRSDRMTAESAAIGLPLYVGAMGGALMVVASGGALAMVLLAAAAGGAVGGSLGGVLAAAIGKTHADRLEASLREGGILFWVAVANAGEESEASEILKRAGGVDVHAQQFERSWGEEDSPFKDWNPDPFLD